MLRRLNPILAAFVLLLGPSTVLAQEVGAMPVPAFEVSAGYSWMRDTTLDETLKKGWYFASAANLNSWFGLAGEVAGAHKKIGNDIASASVDFYTFMAGPRFFVKRGRVVPFAQVLAGGSYVRAKVHLPFEVDGMMGDMKDSETDFAIQPGAGVTVLLTRNVGLRGAVDYRRIFSGEDVEDGNSEVRALAGFVFGWGAR